MLQFKYLSVLVGTLFIIETNQQLIVRNKKACNVVCLDDGEVDYETCECVERSALNKWQRKIRSLDSVSVSKLIRNDVVASRRCAFNEYWNGSECISTICPGGYQWNGRNACIIQTFLETAALVPSAPDTKCKYAKKKGAETTEAAENIQLPPITVMPTFSTSPMCPFGFIWSGDKCVRNPPICPNGYSYHENVCRLNSHEVTTLATTQESHPSIEHILKENIANGNKWQQNPLDKQTNLNEDLHIRYESVRTKQHALDTSDETEEVENPNNQPCCAIMSPRMCRRISNQTGRTWQCYHHKYRRCGDFCTKPTIYLRPKQFSFKEPILIMPPPPPRLMKMILQNHAHRETNIGRFHISFFPNFFLSENNDFGFKFQTVQAA